MAQKLSKGLAKHNSIEIAYPTEANEVFAKLKNHIAMALELNENDFECHRMLSAVHLSTHEYKLAEEHGRKAFDMNPNDPRVLSGYGEVLVRNGSVKEGLELLEKALEIDPTPQGQVNSDNRLKDLLLGHFLGDDFTKCIEISKEIQDIDFKTWILSSFASLKMDTTGNDIEIKREEFWEFDDHDWLNQIDRLHIPNKEKNQSLIDFMAEVTQDIS